MRSLTVLPHRTPQHRRGAAIVEFAMVAPVFLALLLGSIEAGKALETSNLLASALREGGRLASMNWDGVLPEGTTPNQKVIGDIRNFLVASGVPASDAEVTITSAEGPDEGQPFDLADPDNNLRLFRISVAIDYDSVSTYPANFMGEQRLRASLVFRAGRVHLMN